MRVFVCSNLVFSENSNDPRYPEVSFGRSGGKREHEYPIDGTYGMIQEADGRTFPLVPETAATGLFQF